MNYFPGRQHTSKLKRGCSAANLDFFIGVRDPGWEALGSRHREGGRDTEFPFVCHLFPLCTHVGEGNNKKHLYVFQIKKLSQKSY